MTISELIERLTEYSDIYGGDTEVCSMQQPSWPLEYAIGGLVSSEEMYANDDDDDDDEDDDSAVKVFILEGTQLGYGYSRAWDNC